MKVIHTLSTLLLLLSSCASGRALPSDADADASLDLLNETTTAVVWPKRAVPDHLARRKLERGEGLTNGQRIQRGLPLNKPRLSKRFTNAPPVARPSGGALVYNRLYCGLVLHPALPSTAVCPSRVLEALLRAGSPGHSLFIPTVPKHVYPAARLSTSDELYHLVVKLKETESYSSVSYIANSPQEAVDVCASYDRNADNPFAFSVARTDSSDTYPTPVACRFDVATTGTEQACTNDNPIIYLTSDF